MNEQINIEALSFNSLGLPPALLQSVESKGYKTPSPIQAQTIPILLEGSDVIGQAQTGTGKTAAFALPLLSRLKLDTSKGTKILVLAPTRELAMQVSAAFKEYSSHMKGVLVSTIYGGQGYRDQISELKKDPQVVVGTPGRVIDHINKGYLKLGTLSALVLDEADEMLRMGFQEDVETILAAIPEEAQIALFSATMPDAIRRIARTYLKNPKEVKIKSVATTANLVRQRFWIIKDTNKLDGLQRMLEAESHDGVIIFVRTKQSTEELAERLAERGFKTQPLNGDIAQNQRELTVRRFKKGEFDILVATDVAARGLDIDRVSLVINYDMPFDSESYVHRIGRTGRAGQSGDAILFVSPREGKFLNILERHVGKKLEEYVLPSHKDINKLRMQKFQERVTAKHQGAEDWNQYLAMMESYVIESGIAPLEMIATLTSMIHEKQPLFVTKSERPESLGRDQFQRRDSAPTRRRFNSRGGRGGDGGSRSRSSRGRSRDY